jgi:hypothetical protein
MAHGPGFPDGSPAHRYELRVTLDPQGALDPRAWAADPEPWPVRRLWPGEPERHGDVQYDPDSGWSLRLFGGAADAGKENRRIAGQASGEAGPDAAADLADAPLQQFLQVPGTMRPGEYLLITEPDGREYGYRIVGIS